MNNKLLGSLIPCTCTCVWTQTSRRVKFDVTLRIYVCRRHGVSFSIALAVVQPSHGLLINVHYEVGFTGAGCRRRRCVGGAYENNNNRASYVTIARVTTEAVCSEHNIHVHVLQTEPQGRDKTPMARIIPDAWRKRHHMNTRSQRYRAADSSLYRAPTKVASKPDRLGLR